MKKILFRADAKPSIGIGDLVSLINLSKYFEKDDWESHFLIRNYPAGVLLADKHKLKNLYLIDSDFSVQEEVASINGYVNQNDIDVIFFEITERKLSDYKGLDDGVLKACVCFDGQIPNDMDLVVDWDAEAHKFFNPIDYPDTEFLLGTEYVILPLEFDLDKAKDRIYKKKPEAILIAMGGADELNFTQKIIEALIRNSINMNVSIIIGAGYEYGEQLKNILESASIKYDIKQNISNMYHEYLTCDVAIGAGGLTASELVASRTPSVLIATYEHQVARCKYFDSMGYAKYLGFRSFNEKELIKQIMNPPLLPNESIFKTTVIKERVEALFERRQIRS